MRRRTTVAALVALAAAGGVAAVASGALDGRGTGTGAGGDRPPPATTTVTRADLVRSKTVDGTLGFTQRRPVKAAVAGTVTVAAVEGRTVTPGQALYELDDKPVTLLRGPVPMFREMRDGHRGSDVLQLERNLRDLGYGAGLYVDVHYDEATAAAVKRWQKSLNRVPTGRVGRGEVVFQPGPVRIVAVDAALADQVAPGEPVLTVSSTRRVVLAALGQDDGALAAEGTRAEVTLPDGGTARGRVTGTVRPQDTGDGEGGGGDGITVEVTLARDADAGATGAKGTVSVAFVSERREDVLTVPVEAVVALRGEDGGYGLQLVGDGTSTMTRVEVGMTADGRVEVSGPGLREGQRVGTAEG
ncbi:peptidoglycan-binding protein [Streptomyces sp. JNUCC 64]